MTNSVSIRVGAPGAKQASSEIDNLRDKFDRLQKQGAKGFAIGAGAAITAKGLNLIGDAVSGVADALVGSVNAAIDEDKVMARLTASLKANVAGWDGNTEAIERTQRAGIKLGFADNETADAIGTLVAATHDEGKALELLGAAQDLARFKNISLSDAATALTSIEAGRSRGLATLGINVKDYATTEERVAAVEKVAQGQAEAYTKTVAGQGAVISATADEISEKLGHKLIPIVAEAQKDLLEFFTHTTDGFDALKTAAANGSMGASAQLRGLTKVANDNGVSVQALWQEWQDGGGTLADAATRLKNVTNATKDATKATNDLSAANTKNTVTVNTAIGADYRYYLWLKKLAGISPTIFATRDLRTGSGITNLAEGGIVKAKPGGTIVRVAEAGHDEAVVPLSGPSAPKLAPLPPAGTVGNSAFGLAQAELHVHFHLPNAYGMTPGQADALGRAIAPYISRAQQRSGHLAPARAF